MLATLYQYRKSRSQVVCEKASLKGSLGAVSPPPLFECFALLISYKNFIILLNFFNETITLFLKQLEPNSIINGYSNVINGNKTIKSYEFCVKILHQECREVAQKLWFW